MLIGASGSVMAAPEEIVVFADEFEKAGEIGVDLHFNFATGARRTPDHRGEQPPDRVLRFMPEVAWGVSDHWNLGLYLPMSRGWDTGSSGIDGVQLRLQYLDTKGLGNESSWFWGANFEGSYYTRRMSETNLSGELRGIIGWRNADWLVAFNPILNKPLRSPQGVDTRTSLDAFTKVMRNVGKGVAVGVEHYAELNSVRRPRFGPASDQITYAVVEFATASHYEVQIGIGHGWTQPSDRTVYKVLLGLPF